MSDGASAARAWSVPQPASLQAFPVPVEGQTAERSPVFSPGNGSPWLQPRSGPARRGSDFYKKKSSLFPKLVRNSFQWLTHSSPTNIQEYGPHPILNGPLGEAHRPIQSTVEPLGRVRTALQASIPSTGRQAPSATSETCTPTDHEVAEARSANHAIRWRQSPLGGTGLALEKVIW